MDALKQWKSEFAERLSEKLGTLVRADDLVAPPDPTHGDLSFGCFKLAKERGTSPAELAKQVAEGMKDGWTSAESVEAVGPYVNARLKVGEAVHRVILDVETAEDTYGDAATTDRRILLEYAQPNTHKEVHVGHLRNLVLGASLARILGSAGWDVVRMSYHGDVGSHVAKCLWQLVRSHGIDPLALTSEDAKRILASVPAEKRNGEWLGHVYAESTAALEAEPEKKTEISLVQQHLEAHAEAWDALWTETRRWSLDELAQIFEELGVVIDRQYLESEVVARGQALVDELIKKGIAKESQGAIVVDLEEVKLGIFLIRKSDGTSLYATKDLALAELKASEYPDAEQSLIVVDNRQTLYFKQLFETLKRMGQPMPNEFVGYEFVTLASGAMSSREGNVVPFRAFRDALLDASHAEVMKRHDDWPEGKVLHTAWCVMLAGLKFGMLKQDSDKVFVFDLEQAVSFDGATGPYCQYAATRLSSILKKAGEHPDADKDLTLAFVHESEKGLAMALAAFPDVVAKAAEERKPSLVANWCLDCAQHINRFYRDVPVLESSGAIRDGRLRLISAAHRGLSRGLALLGIPLPDEM